MANAWAPSTTQTYGAGLLVYHLFCDKFNIPEELRAPASTDLMVSFVSTLAGAYSGSAVRNYVSAVRAWHILHRLPWQLDQDALDTSIRASQKLAPSSSARAVRQPVTPQILLAIRASLNLSEGRDAAIWACATCLFYGVARLGELTVKTLKDFQPKLHVKPQDVTLQCDRDGHEVTAIFIPWTKVAGEKGEEICFARQSDLTDPVAALKHHLELNKPTVSEHLFAHTYKGCRNPLSRPVFVKRLKDHAHLLSANQKTFTGHSFRIGGTLEYLLRGIPFEVVKTIGRWASDAFKIYLRKHAQILAPYLQDSDQLRPDAFRDFIHITMPPVRS